MANKLSVYIINRDIQDTILLDITNRNYQMVMNMKNNHPHTIKKTLITGWKQVKSYIGINHSIKKITIYIDNDININVMKIIMTEIINQSNNNILSKIKLHWNNKKLLLDLSTFTFWSNIYKSIIDDSNKTPQSYYEWINQYCKRLKNYDVELLNSNEFPLTSAVGLGSESSIYPVLLKPKNIDKSKRNICIVAKSVTYDTGGMNLKANMDEMYADMAASALVISVLCYLNDIDYKISANIYCIMPIVENMIGNKGVKPNTIVKTSGNKLVKITDTDAEGRLCLADGIEWFERHIEKPLIMTIATLTGNASRITGGYSIIGLSNIDINFLKKLGETTGENVDELKIPLEIIDKLKEPYESYIDVKAGCVMAGAFLSKFIHNDWIHLDIAGVIKKCNDGLCIFGFNLLSNFFQTL